MGAAYANWVINHRATVIVVTLLICFVAAAGARHLYFNSSYRVYFGPENPQRVAFEALERTYVKNDSILIVLAPSDGNIFTRENLRAVQATTALAWQTPYSNRVDSISNFQHTEARGDDLLVGNLVADVDTLDSAALSRIRDIALAEPTLRGALISNKGHVTGLFVNVQLPGENETAENAAVVAHARLIAQQIEQQFPEIRVYLTGMIMMNNAFPEATRADARSLIPLAAIAMLVLLGFFVGGFAGTFAAILVFGMAIASAIGLSGYLGYPLTPVSASAPTIILTVAVANCVHILANYQLSLSHGINQSNALIESLRINLQPCFIASLTTAIGFLTLNFSEVPPFRHLGNVVAIGVSFAFVLSVSLLPAFIAILPPSRAPRRESASVTMRISAYVIRRRRLLLWTISILILSLIANISRNELNDVFVEWFDDSIQFRSDTDFATQNLGGLYTTEYSLVAARPGGINEPAFLEDADRFVEWMRAQAGVRHVRSYTDTVKRLNKNLNGDRADMYRLPENRELAAQYLLLYEMSLPYGLDLNNQINVDRSSMRITATLDALSTNELLALNEKAAKWLEENALSVTAKPASGAIIMFANIASRNIRAMLLGTTIALVIISMILMVAFRSFRIGMVSLIPNLVPAAMGFGLWGILDGEIGLSLSIVMSMTLGIVVDDTVHFLSKYLRARRELELSAEDSVTHAFQTVGKALIVTTLMLIAGFAILTFSSYANTADLGLLTAIVIGFALITDFFFLPPLLMKMDGKKAAA